jgi:protein phosphatase
MKTPLVKVAGLTDVGLKRDGNEDFLSIDASLDLYVVADGMGGHLAGEVASRTAVELINKSFRQWKESDIPVEEIFGYPDTSLSKTGNYVLGSIRLANKVIHEMASQHNKYHGMGTTIAVLAVQPGLIISANAGDSPIYLIRNGQIEKISKDHKFVSEQVEMGIMTIEEAEESPMKHVLTKNIGSSENLDPDVFEIEPAKNDRFILCSDGLTDLLSDDEILQMVEEEGNPEVLCINLIDMALQRGGHDNTTVVSVYLSDIKRQKSGLLRKIRPVLGSMFASRKKF